MAAREIPSKLSDPPSSTHSPPGLPPSLRGQARVAPTHTPGRLPRPGPICPTHSHQLPNLQRARQNKTARPLLQKLFGISRAQQLTPRTGPSGSRAPGRRPQATGPASLRSFPALRPRARHRAASGPLLLLFRLLGEACTRAGPCWLPLAPSSALSKTAPARASSLLSFLHACDHHLTRRGSARCIRLPTLYAPPPPPAHPDPRILEQGLAHSRRSIHARAEAMAPRRPAVEPPPVFRGGNRASESTAGKPR